MSLGALMNTVCALRSGMGDDPHCSPIRTVFPYSLVVRRYVFQHSRHRGKKERHRFCAAGRERPHRTFGRLDRKKVGFYKRGCQEKTPPLRQERNQISDIPLPPSDCNTIRRLSRNFFSSCCWSLPPALWHLQAAWVAFGQPWFYLRLVAYCFIGLSEEAYGRSGDSKPEPHLGYSSSNPWRSRGDGPQDTSDYVPMTRCAQAACGFTCSALNVSPSFQILSVMAAILRASVTRAISGRMPLASSPE